MTAETSGEKSPVVSAIIPCYGQAMYLPESVRSIQDQTFPDWECIIINDGSPDDTRDVALELAARDSRIRYLEQANGGVSRARNRGLDEARGRYIQFLDADDLILPEKFERQLELLSEKPGLVLSYCDYYYCPSDDPSQELTHLYVTPVCNVERALQEMAYKWQTELRIPMHSFLFDARFFWELGVRFDEQLENNEDWDCWMNILAWKPAVYYVEGKLAVYRYHGGARTTDFRAMREGYLRAIRKQRSIHRADPEMRQLLGRKISVTKKVWIRYGPWWERIVPESVACCRVIGGRLLPRGVKDLAKTFWRSTVGR